MNVFQTLFMSLQSLRTNKLRTALTMLGVVVGIFSIIVIMTIITMLQQSIEGGLATLNKDTFQIEKFDRAQAHGPGGDQSWRNRKDITVEQHARLKEMLKQAKYVGVEQWQGGKVIKFGSKQTNPNVSIAGANTDAMRTNDWNVEDGRDFIETDIELSNDVCILGQDITDKIFENVNPVGREVRIDGRPFMVIGVLEKQPSMFGQSRDNYGIIPITTFQNMYGKRVESVNITVMAPSKAEYNNTIEAAIGYMRTIRKVEAGKENDFSIFSNESMISQVNNITGGIKIGALAVSIIALLAAGVGIMNIMLVSVTERTKEIGIRKAIGAKRKNILMQFMIEAVILCLSGGLIGIILGVTAGNIAGSFLNAKAAIPYDWVMIGLGLCVIVGLIFGTYPAYKASNLDPIEALRYE